MMFENVATPASAVTVVVPESVASPVLLAMAIVTAAVESATTVFDASSAFKVIAPMGAPATALLGCAVNTRCVAIEERADGVRSGGPVEVRARRRASPAPRDSC